MKAVIIENYGGREQLKESEREVPAITEEQVLLEIHATSINPIDWKLREGYLKEMLPFDFPIILGWDAAGVITEVGSKITDFNVGDRVFARPATTNQGTYAEFVPVDQELLAKMPDEMSYEEAAAIPLAGLTAWQCLVDFSEIKKEEKVLIHAGAGGVGNFAIQIAKHFGAYVATTASKENEEFVKSLGADEVIDYKEQDFSEVLTDYDIVLDAVGGEVLKKSYKVLKQGGRLVSIAGQPEEEEAKKYNVKAGSHWLEPNGRQLQQLAELYTAGELKPVVGNTFDLSEQGLKDAHELSETNHARGKIVIQVK
ncbi:NADP-dependent oxidoreductase [Alkalicoccus daliensis]|uniref:2-desacetyl-2-hydroxyethyl bacteriochlorophyllide A dehydrogenase n=1 Tax=Alkalicoccus daliensis TaxID=745820 RepID=A0A1H0JW38_9BACI|nr:NADP-dependent oxidoreductase [Alkalicoccus daliensis]SDO47702.1 2-desacetyl-2-hydroxyethyl bacteriochlorophyllide A dehydrogenase [Alkalicoccus daliensis]